MNYFNYKDERDQKMKMVLNAETQLQYFLEYIKPEDVTDEGIEVLDSIFLSFEDGRDLVDSKAVSYSELDINGWESDYVQYFKVKNLFLRVAGTGYSGGCNITIVNEFEVPELTKRNNFVTGG